VGGLNKYNGVVSCLEMGFPRKMEEKKGIAFLSGTSKNKGRKAADAAEGETTSFAETTRLKVAGGSGRENCLSINKKEGAKECITSN